MQSLPLSRRQIYLISGTIFALLIILGITSFLLYITPATRPSGTPQPEPSLNGPHTILQLQLTQLVPPSITNEQSTIQINIDTNGDKTKGAQFVLQYDPTVLTDVQITPTAPSGFYPNATVLANYIDSTNGKINFAELLPNGATPVSGKGVLAKISFHLTKNIQNQSSAVTFVDSAAVLGTKQGISVLNKVQNVIIPKL